MPKKKVKRRKRNWFYGKPTTAIQVDPAWQIMRSSGDRGWYAAYLRTRHWYELRKRVFERDGFRCTRCPNTTYLEAHHLTYERLGHELMTDLTTLCNDCHREVHRNKNTGY